MFHDGRTTSDAVVSSINLLLLVKSLNSSRIRTERDIWQESNRPAFLKPIGQIVETRPIDFGRLPQAQCSIVTPQQSKSLTKNKASCTTSSASDIVTKDFEFNDAA